MSETTPYEAELTTALIKSGVDSYRLKDVVESALKVKAETDVRKYEIDKKIEAGCYSTKLELTNKWLGFAQEFLKDSKIQKFFIALLFATTFLISSGRIINYMMEKLYIENKVHPYQTKLQR